MIVVNNILSGNYSIPIMEYLPEKFIIRNVLQNKLKCDKIELDESNGVLKVFWIKEQ